MDSLLTQVFSRTFKSIISFLVALILFFSVYFSEAKISKTILIIWGIIGTLTFLVGTIESLRGKV